VSVHDALPAKPLEGLRVLEFAQIAAGPFTGCLLADLGADVVKVERPDGGDGMRGWPPLHAGEDGEDVFSGNFTSVNRNKRSVALDIKDKADLAKLYELVENADIFIENFRPGAMQRAGLGYDQLKARNPRLIYCSITGYGQTGPYALKGAFDVTVQAMSGLMSVTGEEDGPPVKCGVPVGDFVTGLYAAYVILAAVMRARATGKGAQIDCSILGSLLGISALQTSEYFGTGKVPRRLGSAHPRNAPYAGFQGSDKPFTIAAGNDKLWRDTCAIVGRPDLPDDPRFATQSLRAKNQDALAAILQPIFSTRTSAEWLADFDAKGVPCAPINDFAEILADPHVREAGWVQPMTMPNGAAAETVGFPIALSDYAFEITRQPPRLGEHNDEVLSEWTERRLAKAL
jgi:crotonobetainyl-CoA:carnitine CoA-transferase CaiB-like acyl-CoA transferase